MDPRTLEQLIAITRERLDDEGITRPRWSDASIARALNEAQREAALRGRLLRDDTTSIATINVVAEQTQYLLHRSVFEVIGVHDIERNYNLRETSLYKLGAKDGQWRARRASRACSYFIDVTPSEQLRLNLVDIPTMLDMEAQTLRLDVYRLPLEEMELGAEDEPELAPRHHDGLVEWACYRCFDMRDPDTYDPVKARDHLAEFERQFGIKVDANVHRKQREKTRSTTVARDF